VLVTAIFGAFVSILDATVVNTALPHIQLAFGTDLHTASYVVTGVLPLDMVENLISLCKPISGSFFHHGRAQTGHLLLEESSIRRLLLALSPISHDMLLQPHLA